jgi:hypothetical protein
VSKLMTRGRCPLLNDVTVLICNLYLVRRSMRRHDMPYTRVERSATNNARSSPKRRQTLADAADVSRTYKSLGVQATDEGKCH